MGNLKKCSKCKIEKPLTDFYKRNNVRNGLDYYCKECVKINNAERSNIDFVSPEFIRDVERIKRQCEEYDCKWTGCSGSTTEDFRHKVTINMTGRRMSIPYGRDIISIIDHIVELQKQMPSAKEKYMALYKAYNAMEHFADAAMLFYESYVDDQASMGQRVSATVNYDRALIEMAEGTNQWRKHQRDGSALREINFDLMEEVQDDC